MHRTEPEHRTNVRCVLLHTRAPTVARQSRPSHRTERTGQNFPVRCSVRCSLSSAPWLGLATGQTGRVTGHVRCTPGTFVRCTFSLCLARAILNREHRATGQLTTGQKRLSGAPLSTVRCSVNSSSNFFSQRLFFLLATHKVYLQCARVLASFHKHFQGVVNAH